jgi:transcriptional regulator with XRE-family HTH domain
LNIKLLNDLMKEKKLTAAALAQAVGVSEPMISYIRKGYKQPSLEVAKRIAAELECTLDELTRG